MLNYLKKVNWFYVVILIGVAILASLPFLQFEESLKGMDTIFHLGRMENIVDAFTIRHEVPVRTDLFFYNGYGSAECLMYPNLFMYIPSIIKIFSHNEILSYNLTYVIINFAFTFVMYYATKKLTNNKTIAIIATIIATLSPYRLFTLYIRAAIGELIAQIFIPLLILGFYELIYRNSKKWYILVVAVSGIIQSHIITVFHAFIILSIFSLFNLKNILHNKERLINIVKFLVFTILINLWFLFPFFEYYKKGLLLPVCATPIENSTCTILDYVSFFTANGYTLCLASIIMIIITIVYIVQMFIKKERIDKLYLCLFILSILFMFLSSNYFPWTIIKQTTIGTKYISIMQFAYRFLGYACITLSISISYFTYNFLEQYVKKQQIYIVVIIVVLASAILSFYVHLNFALTNREKVPQGYYVEYVFKAHNNSFYTGDAIEEENYIDLPANYFSYYKVIDDNDNVYDIKQSEDGLVRIETNGNDVDAGTLEIRLKSPLSWRICELISLLSLLFFLICLPKAIKEANKEPKKYYVDGFMIRSYIFTK